VHYKLPAFHTPAKEMVARDGKGKRCMRYHHLPEKLNFSTVEATALLMHACMHTDVHKECMQNKPLLRSVYILGPKV
jgi:hypothetical protein